MSIPCLFCFSTDPPDRVKSKSYHAYAYGRHLEYATNINTFDVPLGDACCHNVCCCFLGFCGAPSGLSACYVRKRALQEMPGAPPGGLRYRCCQGYIPQTCCCDWPNMCVDSDVGLCMEGWCCPIFSISITRILMMEQLEIHPDPGDFQLIRFSNCLQCLSCVCHVAAIIHPGLRRISILIDHIADFVTLSVAGCMIVQITTELNNKTKYLDVYQSTAVGGVYDSSLVTYPESSQPIVNATVVAADPIGAPIAQAVERPQQQGAPSKDWV